MQSCQVKLYSWIAGSKNENLLLAIVTVGGGAPQDVMFRKFSVYIYIYKYLTYPWDIFGLITSLPTIHPTSTVSLWGIPMGSAVSWLHRKRLWAVLKGRTKTTKNCFFVFCPIWLYKKKHVKHVLLFVLSINQKTANLTTLSPWLSVVLFHDKGANAEFKDENCFNQTDGAYVNVYRLTKWEADPRHVDRPW